MLLKQKNTKGFTLIELMITCAIIGVLAAIAVPTFVSFRNKSRIASCLASCDAIRSALGGYAAEATNNGFPTTADIGTDWTLFIGITNRHGANLNTNIRDQGFNDFEYHAISSPPDYLEDTCDNSPGNECASYRMIFHVLGVPRDYSGSQILVEPGGIFRQTW